MQHGHNWQDNAVVGREAANASVPVGVVTANTLFGIPIGDVVLWGTLLYIVLQVLVILPKVLTALKELSIRSKNKCN
jgi:hypothetical protein